jgi:concanavalin A-like lectin/glucanase superfamily protein
MGSSPKPNLVKTTALSKAQAVFARINALLPSYSTPVSPIAVYQPQPVAGILGNELLVTPASGGQPWGVWVAPNLNNGADYAVQVECFAAGGGGGGGTTTAAGTGGGGGAGGEYAAEPVYTVTPGLPYIWLRGLGGPGGTAQPVSGGNQSVQAGGGILGGDTIFDYSGNTLPGGVHAHGGSPGDLGGTGSGGTAGQGSTNTLHSNGGTGGTTQSGIASDNPQTFQGNATYFATPNPPPNPPCWLPMDDATPTVSGLLGNSQNTNQPASITQFTGGLQAVTSPAAPVQVPTLTGSNPVLNPYNPTQYGGCVQFKLGKLSSPSARVTTTSFSYSGTNLMVSGWIQADPSGTWGNPTSGYNATVAANCNYVGGKAGVALYFGYSAGGWTLNWYCSNGNAGGAKTASTRIVTPTPGTWYYIVAEFNGTNMTLYVDGISAASITTSPLTTVPGGAYPMTLGLRPDVASGTYFGYMSNFWFCAATPSATLLSTAYGSLGTATGGSGGGSSGGPYLVNASTKLPTANYQQGNTGSSSAANIGGAGGTTPTQSAYTSGYTTNGEAGGSGSNAGSTNLGTANFGAGGGGAGTSASPLTVQTLTVSVSTAATYNGVDGSQPGVLYNPNQQGTQGTLLAGGQASDPASGTKNSILVLPPGLNKTLAGKTIVDCYLTVYNATPSNTIDPILELNYSADGLLPTNYLFSSAYGSSTPLVPYIMQDTTAAQVISLMNTGFTTALQNGLAQSIVIGPGDSIQSATNPATPYFDAYNAPAGNYFYTSIYGPGALNAFNQSLAPTLTIEYTNSAPQQGQTGGGGYLAVTVIDQQSIPVAAIQPFATLDTQANGFAQGFTGQITAFNPVPFAGGYIAETWHSLAPYLTNSWVVSTNYEAGFRLTALGDLELCGRVNLGSGSSPNIATLPAGYFPNNSVFTAAGNTLAVPVTIQSNGSSILSTVTTAFLALSSGGVLGLHIPTISSNTSVSLDGITIPLSSVPVLY